MQARVLVTHGVGFLPQCDQVMSLDEGSVTEMGTYDELMANNGDFAEFIHVFTNTEENKDDSDMGTLREHNVWIDLLRITNSTELGYPEYTEYAELSLDLDARPSSSADELTIDGHNAIRMRTRRFDQQKYVESVTPPPHPHPHTKSLERLSRMLL